MKGELKKFKHAPNMSEETTAFTSDLYVDGVKTVKIGRVRQQQECKGGRHVRVHQWSVREHRRLKREQRQRDHARTFTKQSPRETKNDYAEQDREGNHRYARPEGDGPIERLVAPKTLAQDKHVGVIARHLLSLDLRHLTWLHEE